MLTVDSGLHMLAVFQHKSVSQGQLQYCYHLKNYQAWIFLIWGPWVPNFWIFFSLNFSLINYQTYRIRCEYVFLLTSISWSNWRWDVIAWYWKISTPIFVKFGSFSKHASLTLKNFHFRKTRFCVMCSCCNVASHWMLLSTFTFLNPLKSVLRMMEGISSNSKFEKNGRASRDCRLAWESINLLGYWLGTCRLLGARCLQ